MSSAFFSLFFQALSDPPAHQLCTLLRSPAGFFRFWLLKRPALNQGVSKKHLTGRVLSSQQSSIDTLKSGHLRQQYLG
ncbi:hypothetical protein ATANTOWER_008966 [Ataeniobius toweri]|uniref:Secreted protein n=1 Tax=Ataeniobius toweri TaxID=208326 RepID=A0ABU7B6W0_9TELE|nr:hypothetical protein [Ataeniobius toweri]